MEEVNCCENGGWIYYNNKEGVFKLIGYDGNIEGPDYGDHPIEYCPWCGILLDTNLLEG